MTSSLPFLEGFYTCVPSQQASTALTANSPATSWFPSHHVVAYLPVNLPFKKKRTSVESFEAKLKHVF